MVPVSAEVKLPGFERKHVLRRALGDRLPRELLRAPKRGFNVPVDEWFRGGGMGAAVDASLRTWSLGDSVSKSAVHDMLARHSEGRQERGAQLWILLQLAHWHRNLGQSVEVA